MSRNEPAGCMGGRGSTEQEPCGRELGGAWRGGNGTLPKVLAILPGAPASHPDHRPRYFPSVLSPCFALFTVLANSRA